MFEKILKALMVATVFLGCLAVSSIFMRPRREVNVSSPFYGPVHSIPYSTIHPEVTPTPIPSLGDDERYDVLTPELGTVMGPNGKETYYNLDMSGVVQIMRDLGYAEDLYSYWIREDGCKMFGPYIMCAADLSTRPKGTILISSLGLCMVCDTGEFVNWNPRQIDIAVNW